MNKMSRTRRPCRDSSRFFEHRLEKPLPVPAFRLRLAKYILGSLSLIAVSLAIGVLGYHATEGFSWMDSFLNASMILSGMGPVNDLKTEAGKLFAGCYALFSGLVLISVAGLIFAPLVHRMLHKFHFDDDEPTTGHGISLREK